ncbi:hypothetical protein OUZ56_005584 [Daphnia magna]|uniref:Ankyrin repeat domain-containing protein n=1 Tax=Daphnia magna TaxID=35525 RepID=A0ABQ9YT62_9CRUS|nr:hypothetical protein OUZ56_005584 [Daphnia magna]
MADATEKWQIPPEKATQNEVEVQIRKQTSLKIENQASEALKLTTLDENRKPEASTYQSPINEDPNYGLPKSINELNRHLKFEISKMHEQFKISMETEHENKLAKEIRDVYCQLSKIQRTQAIILAQTNGILAAATLGLPVCSRLYGFGQAMTLQQCEPKRILLTANETKCGFQPFFNYGTSDCTIGTDGWSIHPYSECFWKSQLVNINGYPHAWEHNETNGDWVRQEATIHTPNLDLIAEFEELHLNDFDFALKSHSAHDTMEMEQLNILNDLVGSACAWNSLGETPLMVAIALKQRESISFLWETSIISKSGRGAETVLHYAAQFNNRNVALGACDSRRGVDVNQRSLPRFESALMVAVRYGNPDIVNVLLKNGATDNNPDKDGNFAQDYIKNQQIRRIFRIWKIPVKTRKQNVPAIHNEENQRKRKRTKFELSTTESEED